MLLAARSGEARGDFAHFRTEFGAAEAYSLEPMLRIVCSVLFCCLPAFAATINLNCLIGQQIQLTGANISAACPQPLPQQWLASAEVTTTSNAVSAYVSSCCDTFDILAEASFTVDETWLITGGTGAAAVSFNNIALGNPDPPSPIAQALLGATGYIDVSATVSGVPGATYNSIPFTFGVPFSFSLQVNIDSGYDYPIGGVSSAGLVFGTQTNLIPFNDDGAPWTIYEPSLPLSAPFQTATLVETISDPDIPEPSFTAPLALVFLAFVLRRTRLAINGAPSAPEARLPGRDPFTY